ncbi:DUF1778 domain-containing protein [Pseudomonas paraveronii]|uniref:type II toxin-antitoxin system TacA family antitoxin n=1 Tax=Pseudomonas paraveronii TaxID=3040598 RepID=UPI002AB079F3|nr:DUF1778 domain-containing protein [Pseudomonas sp. V3/K/3/5]
MTTLDETLKPVKNARLEIKTTDFAKEYIKKAALISGLDMTSFIMASAFEKAETVMENYRKMEVSEKAFSRLQEILNKDKTTVPTPALLNLMRGKHENRRDAGM